jgi:hypothetical protein
MAAIREEALCQLKATALTGKLLAEWRDKRLQEVTGSTVSREIDILTHAINTTRREWGIHINNPGELIRVQSTTSHAKGGLAKVVDASAGELRLAPRDPH